MRDRRTKIICSIGPATHSFEQLKRLHDAGMDVARINMSHASHEVAAEIIHWLKTLNRQVRYPVPVLLDTQGPEIRTGELDAPMTLGQDDEVWLSVTEAKNKKDRTITVNYPELIHILAIGQRVTLDNGLINLEVIEKLDHQLRCRVIDGGLLSSRKHVNLPGVHVNLPSITDKDREDIAFGLAQDIDYIALSFVREASDVDACRALLGRKANNIKIIAKIEDQEGVAHIHDIVRTADGVMVARGDLGIETNIADLPNIQRRIVHSAARWGRRSIVATHMLESMIDHPIPTRAEVTDVANAIYEGADAIMLSGETSIGKYPVRCVTQLNAIAERTELWPGLGYEKDLEPASDKQHIAINAVSLAEDLDAAGVVVITRRGITADLVTNARPSKVRVFAFTNHSQTRRRLALNRAVYAHRIEFSKEPE
ncbi:MAG: pyruvate kinase, partial [Pseudomonadales bacterium]